ncbi:MAG: DUF3099 domain-containing protein [Actinobacteria bacterium]|nr:DUF3099 domain-containing protein [Actinomycetota bacterium]
MEQQYDVTSVGVNPADDRAHRMRVYFIAMSVRLLCVASLLFVRGWWILLVAIAVVVLPYYAVLIANQHAPTHGTPPEAPSPLELTGSAPDPAADAPSEAPSERLLVVDAPADRRPSGRSAPAAGPAPATANANTNTNGEDQGVSDARPGSSGAEA